jgi:hypothetical protein
LLFFLLKTFKIFGFPIFDLGRIWWRLFKTRVVHTKYLDIYVFLIPPLFGKVPVLIIVAVYMRTMYLDIYLKSMHLRCLFVVICWQTIEKHDMIFPLFLFTQTILLLKAFKIFGFPIFELGRIWWRLFQTLVVLT